MTSIDVSRLQRLEHEAHVWLTVPEEITDVGTLADYTSLLSADERERHQRFHFERDRHSYLVSHALVRTMLSTYVDVNPADWRFSAGKQGRPEIAGPVAVPALRFNLTHTAGLTACLVTLGADCGIDAELIIERGNLLAIAKRMFAGVEMDVLKKLDGRALTEQFFIFWTLREAYCKALGTGLGFSKKDYGFETGKDGVVKLCFDAPVDDSNGAWQFTVLRLVADHIVAVAVRAGEAGKKQVVHSFVVP